MANTISTSALRAQLWQKELFKDVMDDLYFYRNGLMGEGENSIIQVKNDLKKNAGDRIILPLTTKLTGAGITGDSELEGQEDLISSYGQSVLIDQWRNAVRLTGRLDEQKVAYDMRSDAKAKLSAWIKETLEQNIFLKLGGVTTTTLTDVNGVTYSAGATWSNTPGVVPSADEDAGVGARYICAKSTGLDAMAATDVLTPALISRAKTIAVLANPRIRPLRVEGKEYYVMFVHPWQAYDLKNASSSIWAQAQRDAQVRGDSNPIFTGALGIWDGVILYEHPYVPVVRGDASLTFGGGQAVSNAVYAFRSLLCGQQAAIMVQTDQTMFMKEKEFDYENKVGYATGIIGGIQKTTFNSKDYAVVTVDTGATILST